MIIKILIILIMLLIFYLLMSNQIEKFSDKNYTNTNMISANYNNIYSVIPYDIKYKNEQSNLYDFGNDELNIKFIEIFKINCMKLIKNIEGISWSIWYIPNDINYTINLDLYYKKVIKIISKNIQDKSLIINNSKYEIINNNLNRYKISNDNPDTYLLDIDFVIYRNNRPLAKHIKTIVITNGQIYDFMFIKVIGVIKQCDLTPTTIKSYSNDNMDKYQEFLPEKHILFDKNSFIYDTNDKLVNSEIEYNIYHKLFKGL